MRRWSLMAGRMTEHGENLEKSAFRVKKKENQRWRKDTYL